MRSGFTLLEVMVAVALLSIALTAIFSSEAGSVKMAQRAKRLTNATLLARCKMGEIEERTFKEGLPAIDAKDEDKCCEGGEINGFRCEWDIKRIVLPEAKDTEDEEDLGKDTATKLGEGEDPSSLSPDLFLSGKGTSSNAVAQDALASAAFEYVFPILKPAVEEQVRRATVQVKWKEGDKEQTLELVQYLVNEQRSALTPGAIPGLTPGTTPGTATPSGTQQTTTTGITK